MAILADHRRTVPQPQRRVDKPWQSKDVEVSCDKTVSLVFDEDMGSKVRISHKYMTLC